MYGTAFYAITSVNKLKPVWRFSPHPPLSLSCLYFLFSLFFLSVCFVFEFISKSRFIESKVNKNFHYYQREKQRDKLRDKESPKASCFKGGWCNIDLHMAATMLTLTFWTKILGPNVDRIRIRIVYW